MAHVQRRPGLETLDCLSEELDLTGNSDVSLASKHRRLILALLTAVDAQRPDAWMPAHRIADFRTDRDNYHRVRAATWRLIRANKIQYLHAWFGQKRRLLIRSLDHDDLDFSAIEHTANEQLTCIGHHTQVRPSGRVSTDFTKVTVTFGGRLYPAYQLPGPCIVASTTLGTHEQHDRLVQAHDPG